MTISLTNPARVDRTMLGILCGVGAGALWGLVFLAPELAGDFSPLELMVGRYLAYGVISLALIAPRWRRLYASLGTRDWVMLGFLALTGNTLYYVLLSAAVQFGGIAMTSLVIGFLPVAVTIIGSRDKGAVPLRALMPSLLLCVAGAGSIGWQALSAPSGDFGTQVTGLVCAIAALAMWTTYAVANSRALTRLHDVSVHDWSLLVGIVTGAQALLMLPVALALAAEHSAEAWVSFGAVSVAVAVLASILGNGLWNKMSRLLPLTMTGQMILFETLFALVYGFLWEGRWPEPLEMLSFLFVVGSVVSCIAVHREHARG
jgi:drug/metabolite transporter (DMT)-like permease